MWSGGALILALLLICIPGSESQFSPYGFGPGFGGAYNPYFSWANAFTPYTPYGPEAPISPTMPFGAPATTFGAPTFGAPPAAFESQPVAPTGPSAPMAPTSAPTTQFASALGATQGGPPNTQQPTIVPVPQISAAPTTTLQILPVPVPMATQAPVTLLASALGATQAPVQIALPATTTPVTLLAGALSATQGAGNVAAPLVSQPVAAAPVAQAPATVVMPTSAPVYYAAAAAANPAGGETGPAQVPITSYSPTSSMQPIPLALIITARSPTVQVLRAA